MHKLRAALVGHQVENRMRNEADGARDLEENVDSEIEELPVFDFHILVEVRALLVVHACECAVGVGRGGQAAKGRVRRPRENQDVRISDQGLVGQQQEEPHHRQESTR